MYNCFNWFEVLFNEYLFFSWKLVEFELKSQHPQSLYHYIGDNVSWISQLWEKIDKVC